MSTNRKCACPYIKDKAQCPSDAAQKDLLCDFCSGRNSIGDKAIDCATISLVLGQGLSLKDHSDNSNLSAKL